MADSLLDDSVFDVAASSDFEPEPKTKSKAALKAAPKKPAVPKVPKVSKAKKAPLPSSKVKPASKKRQKPDTEDEASEPERPSFHDDTLLSNTPPSAKKPRKGPMKKMGGKPLQPIENEVPTLDGAGDAKPQKGATDQYQKLTQLEHIIKRPDTYIGSVERLERQMWVYNAQLESMEFREVSYVPGLYKIFDEILVNAADNKVRDKNMDTIKVSIDRAKGEISVYNNGRGIPIEIHEKEKIYIPEMIFGHLLTSSNYDDDEAKITGGRNGYGAKLCNVFSREFVLETADSHSKKNYKQTWSNNMSKMSPAKITAQKGDDYTKVTFYPDFAKFKMEAIDDDFEALVMRRVYDIAGTSKGVKVYLNGKKIPMTNDKTNFKKYMEMYTKAIKRERGEEAANDTSEIVTDSPDPRWEIGFAVSDGTFQQVSFVNSIATTSGGKHVDYIADQISTKLLDFVKKKNKGGAALKIGQIRNHIFLFVNCLVVNPAFTSQTKEQLTTKASAFGSKCVLSDEFLRKICKTDIVTNILNFAQQKADLILKKSDGARRSRVDNPKLTDANRAGTKDGYQCTLILTEGDSSKGLAMAGRAVVDPDLFGVFPLRGKLLNVRDASIDQIAKNAEIQNIKNILGLRHKQEYTDCRSLRYGHIMIMTDQDHDGSHIKGLLINFLQVQFPSLLQIPKFLIEFITPIIKVYKGDPRQHTKSKTFFTMPEYQQWKLEHAGERGWEHKYYKGLGTSSTEEAQIYFRDLDRHLKEFHAMQEKEPELIELAFSKKKADERKEWLRQCKPGTYLDHSTRIITYTDFVNKELILYSMADNLRSIPSVVDGFKPGQRKVLFACFKRSLKKDMKVVELAGFVSTVTAYHHGESSLQQTIVGLAQTFVGSNNVNCLEPSGNFGSRLQGGSDCASARYIFTRLSPFARRVFHPLDEQVLRHNKDDDRKIEPEMYIPVVPMILINGADGIGTGWSSSIPNYNPEDIVQNLRGMMDGNEPTPMTPWFRDFQGTVEQVSADRYVFKGICKQISNTEVEITELPIRLWTQDFKDKLSDIIRAEKAPSWIKEYDDYNTHKQVHFKVRLEEKFMQQALKEGLEEKFKLTKSIATSNMVAFDAQGRITKYNSTEDIMRAFYDVRIKCYADRKAAQLDEFNEQLGKMSNQARFIQMIIDGKLVVAKKAKKLLVEEMKQKNFKPYPKIVDASQDGEVEPAMENADEDDDEAVGIAASAYDYLLGMAIWSLTKERVEKLRKQIADKEEEIDVLIKTSEKDLWRKDLDDFIQEWRFQLEDEKRREKKVQNLGRRTSSKVKTHLKPVIKKRKNDDSDFDTDSSVKKAKKNAAISKLPSLLAPMPPKAKPISKASAPTVSEKQAAQKAETSKPDIWMTLDGASSELAADSSPKPKLAGAAKQSSSKPTKVESDEDKHIRPAATMRAPARAAARKPVKYNLHSDSDSDSNGDDMLFDVSKMVKGIDTPAAAANTTTASSTTMSRPLFSATASLSRPGSSAGIVARKSLGRDRTLLDAESADDTDYTRLAPAAWSTTQARAKSAFRATDERNGDNDEDDDSEDAGPKTMGKGSKAAVKPTAKPAAIPAAKTKAPAAAKALKPKPSAPAATTAAARTNNRKTKATANEVEQMADELLDDDDDDEDESLIAQPAAKPAPPSGRPARQAAAAPKNWAVVDIDDDDDDDEADGGEEDEESEEDFDADDSE